MKNCPRKQKRTSCLYRLLEPVADFVKILFQMTIGSCLFVFLVKKSYLILMSGQLPAPGTGAVGFFEAPVLEVVGYALGLSAAVELAFMLFTEGPDEAIDPLILGIAAAALITVSKIKESDIWSKPSADGLVWQIALAVFALSVSLALLLYMREKYRQWKLKREAAEAGASRTADEAATAEKAPPSQRAR